MKEIIYVYTTETYKSKNWYKIGMTNQESGSVRISQQDGTSNPEKLEKQYEVNLFGETELTAYEVEQKIHRFYERLGKRVRDNREWFEVDGGIEEIKKVIESILDNSDLHKSEIKLKPHQVQANTKINDCFNSDDKRCLLAHKPRSGKTFTTIYNIKENNYKNVVILTSYPILNFQWEEVILGFKGFSNTEINLVDIVGGISYSLIDEEYNGNCMFNGNLVDLSKFDIIVNPKYYSILNKLSGRVGLDTICKGQSYSVITNDSRLSKVKVDDSYIKCYVSQVNGLEKWIKRIDVKQSVDLSKWKVITARANGSYPRFGNKFIGKNNEVCNQSYIVFEVNNEEESKSLLSYISTKFANCLLSFRKITQDLKPDTCKWIPIVPFDREWTDELLFDYFNLTEEERNIVLNYDKK